LITPLSLDQLVAHALGHARNMLIGKPNAMLLPIFHIQFKNQPDAIVPMSWRDEAEKSARIRRLRLVMRAFRASIVNYAFLTEAWVASQDHPFRDDDLLPNQREDRKEIVFIQACDGLDSVVKCWNIVRDDNAVITDLIEDKKGVGEFSGRMANLLEDEP
jgi:hypothetical protein